MTATTTMNGGRAIISKLVSRQIYRASQDQVMFGANVFGYFWRQKFAHAISALPSSMAVETKVPRTQHSHPVR